MSYNLGGGSAKSGGLACKGLGEEDLFMGRDLLAAVSLHRVFLFRLQHGCRTAEE